MPNELYTLKRNLMKDYTKSKKSLKLNQLESHIRFNQLLISNKKKNDKNRNDKRLIIFEMFKQSKIQQKQKKNKFKDLFGKQKRLKVVNIKVPKTDRIGNKNLLKNFINPNNYVYTKRFKSLKHLQSSNNQFLLRNFNKENTNLKN